jgi:hypothetical protein
MNNIINFNRQTLNSVENWIKDEDYNSPPIFIQLWITPKCL